jgi:hypothetical protein
MNQRQLNKVISLYRDGVGAETCISNIASMSKTIFEQAIFINKFYEKCFINPLKEELERIKDEPHSREEPSNLEN